MILDIQLQKEMTKMISIIENFLFWTALSFIVLLIFTCLALRTRKEKKRNYKYMAIIFMLGIYLSNVTFMSSLIFLEMRLSGKKKLLLMMIYQ